MSTSIGGDVSVGASPTGLRLVPVFDVVLLLLGFAGCLGFAAGVVAGSQVLALVSVGLVLMTATGLGRHF